MSNVDLDPEKISKWWKVVKTIVELILSALGGAAVAASANACGMLALLG